MLHEDEGIHIGDGYLISKVGNSLNSVDELGSIKPSA